MVSKIYIDILNITLIMRLQLQIILSNHWNCCSWCVLIKHLFRKFHIYNAIGCRNFGYVWAYLLSYFKFLVVKTLTLYPFNYNIRKIWFWVMIYYNGGLLGSFLLRKVDFSKGLNMEAKPTPHPFMNTTVLIVNHVPIKLQI